jgi:hypothetical protein
LSRSSSAAGTIIIQGFDAKKITGGCSGALRQEFRELELLDEIVKQCFEGTLPVQVIGDRRNTLIAAFRVLKRNNYVPPNVHPAVKWSKSDPLVQTDLTDVPWDILRIKNQSKSSSLPTDVSCPSTLSKSSKRKVSAGAVQSEGLIKKRKLTQQSTPNSSQDLIVTPYSVQWFNNSCAYDSVISILFNLWNEDKIRWSTCFAELNQTYLLTLSNAFHRHVAGEYNLYEVREFLRRTLHRDSPDQFQWGELTSVHALFDYILKTPFQTTSSQTCCPDNHPNVNRAMYTSSAFISAGNHNFASVQDWVTHFTIGSGATCIIVCDKTM